jgi:thiopurine S-methyltransferase
MSLSFATSPESATAASKNEHDERLRKWSERWSNNTTGWHSDNVHESLVKFGSHIIPGDDTCPENGVRLFVPLCGKSVDLAYLASQPNVAEVVGLDGIRKALEEFSNEHPSLNIQPVSSSSLPTAKYERFQGNSILLLKGDFFDLDETAAGGRFDAVWDRASIVAIQPELRKQYVDVISKVIKPGGMILLAALERRTGSQEGINAGPPFSVPEAEVRNLYEGQDWVESVELLEEVDQFERKPEDKERFSQSGVTSMYELVFVIKVKE